MRTFLIRVIVHSTVGKCVWLYDSCRVIVNNVMRIANPFLIGRRPFPWAFVQSLIPRINISQKTSGNTFFGPSGKAPTIPCLNKVLNWIIMTYHHNHRSVHLSMLIRKTSFQSKWRLNNRYTIFIRVQRINYFGIFGSYWVIYTTLLLQRK